VKLWPTPNASDATKWSNQSLADRQAKGQQVRLVTAVAPEGGMGGQLNPQFVEWLMGFPIGHTDLKPSEMPLSRSGRSSSPK
jgi:DNA (cytosine-5)-methyltransferase 1